MMDFQVLGGSRIRTRFVWLAAGIFATACGRGEPTGDSAAGSGSGATSGETAVAAAPAVPPRPASQRILGRWEFRPPENTPGPVLAIEFAPDALRRFTNGRETSTQQWVIVDETADDVAIEVTQLRHGRSTRDRWRLLDDGRLVHEAAPDIVYVRAADVVELPAEGSAATSP
jgi:hypothetical protein